MTEYLEDVRRFDSRADEAVVGKIVKHLGIALRGKDSSLVSCSDTKELDRVREKWSMKKLGETDASACDEVIGKVCEDMKSDRNKSRVTFYYLVAKHHDKLASL
ncbi:MAG: DUF2853 family protein [Pseudomonadota bacterium]